MTRHDTAIRQNRLAVVRRAEGAHVHYRRSSRPDVFSLKVVGRCPIFGCLKGLGDISRRSARSGWVEMVGGGARTPYYRLGLMIAFWLGADRRRLPSERARDRTHSTCAIIEGRLLTRDNWIIQFTPSGVDKCLASRKAALMGGKQRVPSTYLPGDGAGLGVGELATSFPFWSGLLPHKFDRLWFHEGG